MSHSKDIKFDKRMALIAKFKALKMFHKTVKSLREHEGLGSIIKQIRYDLKRNIANDCLSLRENSSFNYRCRIFFANATMYDYNVLRFNPDKYYAKEFKRLIKGEINENELHLKDRSFEFNGEFYNKDEYFSDGNKVYDRKRYFISRYTGRVIDSLIEREYVSPTGGMNTLTLTDGTKFRSDDFASCDPVLYIRFCENAGKNHHSFLFSMFDIAGERNGGGWGIGLSEKELKALEFKPMPAHKSFFNDMAIKIAKDNNISLEEAKKRTKQEINCLYKFKIDIGNSFGRAGSVAKKMLKRVLEANFFSNLGFFDLIEALNTCKKFLGDEKEAKQYVMENGLVSK